ncbi:BT_3987 domain-containing protein [Polaribacter sargassicola]|uniref:BT_3987 domain-containing protein n=1 Tax=Polaribacter sargassicola TaxID=2836891 RepID=UPI001F27C2FC|nr:DUF1735 domain-containing protein [Polaribacter sp. DS7-9]MCG1035813.1 DUF1735 domain-containing protein [Polaribacter sp. DS7-9]
MKIKNISLILLALTIMFSSCEKYDDYIEDFDYTTVYFATQKPLRTIVSYDNMEFKVGVSLGGKRTNDVEEYASFQIDEDLLNTVSGASGFTLLPEAYYQLSNDSQMNIPKGEFIGDVTVSLNRDLFTSDPLATQNTYALPIRITESSLDSILDTKDYTVLVVKYISEYSGVYYHKGTQKELDDSGAVVDEIEYNESDLINNQTWEMTTVDRNSIRTPGIGALNNQNFVININEEDNIVTIDNSSSGITNLAGSGIVNDDRSITLDYSYTAGGTNYQVSDTLILRQAVEYDLRFEEW